MRVHWVVSTVLSAAVGAGAALFAVAAMNSDKQEQGAEKADEHSPAAHSSAVEQRTVVVEGDVTRLSALEREVDRMRSEMEAMADQGEAEPPAIPSPEEERRHLEQVYGAYDQRFEAESYDPSWSGQATSHLGNALQQIKNVGEFSVVSAECKSAVCRASLRWDNYDSAVAHGQRLPEQRIPGLNCIRSMWLKEPTNPQAPYTAELYLDCAAQRGGLAEAVPPSPGEMP